MSKVEAVAPKNVQAATVLLCLVPLVHIGVILPYVLHPDFLQGIWIGAVAFHVIMLGWFPWQARKVYRGSAIARKKVTKMIVVTALVGGIFVEVLARDMLYYQIILAAALCLDVAICALLWRTLSAKHYFAQQ